MKEYQVSVITKKKETLMDIINDVSQYECEITIDKPEIKKPYAFDFSETAYHKLGEKKGRTIDEYKKDMNLYNFLGSVLKEYGISDKHKGFRFAIECVRVMNLYGVEQYTLDNDVYPIISKWYQVTPSCIEHNIRNAIKISWCNYQKNKDGKNKIASFDERPTNLKFLRHIANKTNLAFTNAY